MKTNNQMNFNVNAISVPLSAGIEAPMSALKHRLTQPVTYTTQARQNLAQQMQVNMADVQVKKIKDKSNC